MPCRSSSTTQICATIVGGLFMICNAAAQDSSSYPAWNDEGLLNWSPARTQEFLRRSPWVRYWGDLRYVGDVTVNGRPQSVPAGTLAIRWESAPLVREALIRVESSEYNDALARLSRDYYVLAVVRMPPQWSAKQTDRTRLSGHWTPEQEGELRNARALQLPQQRVRRSPPVLIGNEHAQHAFSVSSLSIPGDEAIPPARVESWVKETVSCRITFTAGKVSDIDQNSRARQVGTIDLIMFSRSLALENGAGDVEFRTTEWLYANAAKQPTFKAKFSLKDLARETRPPDKPIALPAAPPNQTPTVSLGQTIDQIVAILGQPESVVDLGSKKIYVY